MRQIIIRIIKFGMLPFGMIHALLHRKSGLTILMYHRVNDLIRKELSVKKKNFAWQMEYLYKKGYLVISMDEAIRLYREGSCRKREKYVVLTFDDGYEDFYTDAFPVLRQYNYPSIIYLVPGYIETDQVFWWDRDLGESRLLNWRQIGELADSGLVTIASHTMSHPDFNKIKPEEIKEEILQSQKLLQEKLSIKINHFSYPRGIVTAYSRKAAKTVYKTAVSIFNGYELMPGRHKLKAVGYETALMQLKRLPVQRSDGRCLFAARLKGWLVPEEWIKRFLIRY